LAARSLILLQWQSKLPLPTFVDGWKRANNTMTPSDEQLEREIEEAAYNLAADIPSYHNNQDADVCVRYGFRAGARWALSRAKVREAILVEALKFYANEDVYVQPSGWSCAKNGGPPTIDDFENVSGIARQCLNELGVE
jgi:hypothetical protein